MKICTPEDLRKIAHNERRRMVHSSEGRITAAEERYQTELRAVRRPAQKKRLLDLVMFKLKATAQSGRSEEKIWLESRAARQAVSVWLRKARFQVKEGSLTSPNANNRLLKSTAYYIVVRWKP